MIFALSTHNVLKRLLEKGAAYERLGFPANQKKYAIGFFLFFPPSSFKAKKKKQKIRCVIPDFQVARRELPAQTRMSNFYLLVLYLTKRISVTDFFLVTTVEHMAPGLDM